MLAGLVMSIRPKMEVFTQNSAILKIPDNGIH